MKITKIISCTLLLVSGTSLASDRTVLTFESCGPEHQGFLGVARGTTYIQGQVKCNYHIDVYRDITNRAIDVGCLLISLWQYSGPFGDAVWKAPDGCYIKSAKVTMDVPRFNQIKAVSDMETAPLPADYSLSSDVVPNVNVREAGRFFPPRPSLYCNFGICVPWKYCR